MCEILRSALLSKDLSENKWRKLLPGLVFTLNSSISRATKAIPNNVVFGHSPALPVGVLFGTSLVSGGKDSVSPPDYSEELGISLKQTGKQ